jgi:hypothetical protein
MKLFCTNYESPLDTQGTLSNVYIEDVELRHRRIDKTLSILFEMYYFKNGKKVILDRKEMLFFGMERDEFSSNKMLLVERANPDYDALVADSQEKITVPLFNSTGYTFDVQAIPFDVVDFGFPTYEKVFEYFDGGNLGNPEIIIVNPLAMGFIKQKLILNNEPVGVQFQFV